MGNQVIAYPRGRWDWLYAACVVLAVGAHIAGLYWNALRDKWMQRE